MEWRELLDFPKYEINRQGEIRNIRTGKVLQQRQDSRGYMVIRIYRGDEKYTRRISKLLWEAFNECKCKETVDHIDRNKHNNTLENLRCIPWKENSKNRDNYNKGNKYSLTPELKKEIARRYRNGNISLTGIMKQYGIPVNYSSVCLRRGSWEKNIDDRKGISKVQGDSSKSM
jgi:hypothetical protein